MSKLFNNGICCFGLAGNNPCKQKATFQSCNIGNWTDNLAWCSDHALCGEKRENIKPIRGKDRNENLLPKL